MKSIPETRATRCFLDSNIWLYAFIISAGEHKNTQARAIIETKHILISAQVINEVCINLIRKAAFSEQQVQQVIESFYYRHEVIESGLNVLKTASRLRSRYQFSFWDSLIVASALAGEASVVYSENMHNALVVEDRLRIENPFASNRSR
jgi:predicted nucleic acid-binding protein